MKFNVLSNTKIKTRISTNGFEYHAEYCTFLDDGSLIIFQISVVDLGRDRMLTVAKRRRNEVWTTYHTQTSKRSVISMFANADICIEHCLKLLNKALEVTS